MSPAEHVDSAVAAALSGYRRAIARHGLAGSDDWLIGYIRTACRRPDDVLAAVVRALLFARDERRPPGRG